MSNVFFYEPFYDFDRFLDEALGGASARRSSGGVPNGQVQRRPENVDGAVRHFKPRYVTYP